MVFPSSLIHKTEKAVRYAREKNTRITFHTLEVEMVGDNNHHQVSFDKGLWQCDCPFFQTNARCAHTMALENILEKMIHPQPKI